MQLIIFAKRVKTIVLSVEDGLPRTIASLLREYLIKQMGGGRNS